MKSGIMECREAHVPPSFTPASEIEEGAYLHEWIGLLEGWKPAAIFYMKPSERGDFLEEAKERGFSSEFSDFAYAYFPAHTEKRVTGITDECRFSAYVSKNPKICRKLKYLDAYHQFGKATPSGLQQKDLFFGIGRLLGFPECCTGFIWGLRESRDFRRDMRFKGILFDEETLYLMEALKRSAPVDHLLNNFSDHLPKLINFSVCGYGCRHALAIAGKVKESLEKKEMWNGKEDMLRAPLMFFSPRESIFFAGVEERDGKIHYASCTYKESHSSPGSGLSSSIAGEAYRHLSNGDAFSATGEWIEVFSGRMRICLLKKRHKYDGVFISPQ